jgi:hypothetical protein
VARRRLVVAAGSLAAALLAAPSRPARAGCALEPQILFSPAAGTALPPHPTVFVFLRRHPYYDAVELGALTVTDGAGRPLAFARADLPSAGGARVARLTVTAAAGPFTVHARAGSQSGAATYRLGAPPAPVSTPATSIVEAEYTYATGCPPANGFVLAISPQAPAYRVEVDGDTWIVPDQPGPKYWPGRGTIVTGMVGCFEFTIPTDKPLALSITPLLPDGTEGDTRSQNCEKTTSERCWPNGKGGKRCVGASWSCTSGRSWTLRGSVTRWP